MSDMTAVFALWTAAQTLV